MRASTPIRIITAAIAVSLGCAATFVGVRWAAGQIAPGGAAGETSSQERAYDPTRFDAGRLDAGLQERFKQAKAAAGRAGHKLQITSGYRSWDTQLALYEQQVAETGSPAEARKLVLPPWESMHVRGRAIDVGGKQAAKWLERNGYKYGLCRRYANEWWHFEPLVKPGTRCPQLEPDASAGNPPPKR